MRLVGIGEYNCEMNDRLLCDDENMDYCSEEQHVENCYDLAHNDFKRRCISLPTFCDGFWNCFDGADEVNCNESIYWTCPSRHHLCMEPEIYRKS